MRFILILALLTPSFCAAQTATGHAQTQGPCSPAITGNNNTLTLNNCGKGEKGHEVLSVQGLLKSIAEIGAKATIAVRSGDIGDPPLTILKSEQRTGFWVDARGYPATCFSASDPPPIAYPHIVVIVLIRPLPGDLIEMSGGVVNHSAEVKTRRNGIAILYVAGIDEVQASFSALDSRVGKLNETAEHITPNLATELPDVGEEVFLVGVEPGLAPRLSTVDGRIVSVGPSSEGPIRIFATLQFKPSYCGAPVFNSKKQIIGLVEKASDNVGELVVIPSTYILRSIRVSAP